jgi:hypothetical protein
VELQPNQLCARLYEACSCSWGDYSDWKWFSNDFGAGNLRMRKGWLVAGGGCMKFILHD